VFGALALGAVHISRRFGFDGATVVDGGESYRVKRVSDGVVLPVSIRADDIAEERARVRYDRL
jgi:hypothetical protein